MGHGINDISWLFQDNIYTHIVLSGFVFIIAKEQLISLGSYPTYRMKLYAEFNLARWLRVVKFTG